MRLEQPCVRTEGGAHARAHRLRGDPEGNVRVEWPQFWPCGCGAGRLLWLRARTARWSSRDGRIRLTGPVLGLSSVPLVAAPYWSIPTRPGTSGLLAPRVGYSGRDGLRVAQPVYLAWRGHGDLLLAAGGALGRGPTAGARLRYFTRTMGDGELRVRGVWEDRRPRGWVRGRAVLGNGRWSAQLEPRLVSDESVLADLAETTRLEVAPYQRSRLWLAYSHPAVSAASWLDLVQPVGSPIGSGRLLRGQLRLASEPLLLGPAALTMTAELMGVGDVEAGPAAMLGSDGVRRLTRGVGLWLAPSLAFQRQIGPLRTTALLGYRLRGAWSAATGQQGVAALLQSGLATAEIGLPLFRRYAGATAAPVAHEVEVYLLWQSLATIAGPAAAAPLLDQQLLIPGHFGGAGVRSQLYWPASPTRRWVAADGRVLVGDEGAAVAVAAEGSPWPWLQGELELLYDLRERRLANASAHACINAGRLRSCAGYRRQRAISSDLLPFAADAAWPSVGALPGALSLANWLDLVSLRLDVRLGRLDLGGQVYLDPLEGALTHGRYWAAVFDSCRCLGLELGARSRPGGGVPDVLVSVRFQPDWGAGCLQGLSGGLLQAGR